MSFVTHSNIIIKNIKTLVSITGSFTPLERIILTANGNLQRILRFLHQIVSQQLLNDICGFTTCISAYYGSTITVDIKKCDQVRYLEYDREVNLVMSGQVGFRLILCTSLYMKFQVVASFSNHLAGGGHSCWTGCYYLERCVAHLILLCLFVPLYAVIPPDHPIRRVAAVCNRQQDRGRGPAVPVPQGAARLHSYSRWEDTL